MALYAGVFQKETAKYPPFDEENGVGKICRKRSESLQEIFGGIFWRNLEKYSEESFGKIFGKYLEKYLGNIWRTFGEPSGDLLEIFGRSWFF